MMDRRHLIGLLDRAIEDAELAHAALDELIRALESTEGAAGQRAWINNVALVLPWLSGPARILAGIAVRKKAERARELLTAFQQTLHELEQSYEAQVRPMPTPDSIEARQTPGALIRAQAARTRTKSALRRLQAGRAELSPGG